MIMSGSHKRKKSAYIFAVGIIAAALAAVILFTLTGTPGRQSGPQVHSARKSIALLQSRSTELGYSNALSKLTEQSESHEKKSDRTGTVPLGNEGPVEYDLDNITRIHRVNYQDNTNYYTFYPILYGDAAGIGAINEDLYQIAEAFMQEKSPAEIEETHYAYGRQFCYSHTQAFNITHNGDGIISFRISSGGFWGNEEMGRYDIYYGRTYHLGTGQVLSLTDLVDMEQGLLKERIRECLEKKAGTLGLQVADFDLDTIPFWIWEGQLYVALYDDPLSPYHTYNVETGIFIF